MRKYAAQLAFILFMILCITLWPAAAHAQSEPAGDTADLANYGVRCEDGRCRLTVDVGPIDAQVPVPVSAPIQLNLPDGNLGIFSGAGVEIADGLTLKLSTGDIHIDTGDLVVGVDDAGNVQRLQGSAEAVVPRLTLPNNLRLGGEFAVDFGYDVGAALGDLSHLLDPDAQYFYMRVGDGFSLDTTLTGADGEDASITLAVPENESATVVIDPRNQVLYLDGRFNVSQVVRLALVGATLGIDVEQLPLLSGLALPLQSTVGVAALLARDPARSFVEVNGDLTVEGGPLGRLLQLGATPLMLDSTVRIDGSGMTLQGRADAALAPETLLQSGGTVELFVPFAQLRDAYVRLGGELSVPVLGIAAENATILQSAPEGVTMPQLPWWDEARGWIDDAASRTAGAVAGGAQVGIEAVQDAVDAVRTPDETETDGEIVEANAGTEERNSAVSCGVNRAQRLWCESTGLCEVPEDTCPPATVND